MLGVAVAGREGPVLLGCADRLPAGELAADGRQGGGPLLYTLAGDGGGGLGPWSGWAWADAGVLADLPRSAGEGEAGKWLARRPGARSAGRPTLGCRTYGELLEAHRMVLAKEFPGLLLSGREVEPGVWLSRNVSLHPTAAVNPPVYVAADCRIGQGVQLGPEAVLGQGSVVDRHTVLARTVVLPRSYVGAELEIGEALVDRGRLVSVRLGAALEVDEAFLLGSLAEGGPGRSLRRGLGRAVAGALFLLGAPAVLAALAADAARGRRPRLRRLEILRQPAPADPARWRSFRLLSLEPDPACRPWRGPADLVRRLLPGLYNAARGEVSLVGLPLRAPDQARSLPKALRRLVARAPAGLVDEAAVVFGPAPGNDARYSAEAYYVAVRGLRHDLAVLGRYLAAVAKGLRRGS
jgi:hypothetical protein